MTRLFVFLLLLLTAPVSAQTPPIDDCPSGHELHHSLTALDHASMTAAYTASFVGLFHRAPIMQPGSGSDDGEYWISNSNHYGLYGDDVCRAGWNLYRERQLGGLPTGPRDGDLPASFLPAVPTPTPVPMPVPPIPPPTPQSSPSCQAVDLTPMLTQLINLNAQVTACNQGIATVDQNINQFHAEVKGVWDSFGKPLMQYVVIPLGTALATWSATHK